MLTMSVVDYMQRVSWMRDPKCDESDNYAVWQLWLDGCLVGKITHYMGYWKVISDPPNPGRFTFVDAKREAEKAVCIWLEKDYVPTYSGRRGGKM